MKNKERGKTQGFNLIRSIKESIKVFFPEFPFKFSINSAEM